VAADGCCFFDGVWMLFQPERFWPVRDEDRSSLQRQKICIVKTHFSGCTPVQGNSFLAICILHTEWLLHSEDVLSYTLSSKNDFFLISRKPYSDNVLWNVLWKYYRKAVIYVLCVVEATAHVICCSRQSGSLEENPLCRNLWLEIQDCLSMGEHDGHLISASQEKYHVMHSFYIFCCWDMEVRGGRNLSSGVHTELRRVTIPLSYGRVSASVSQFRENTPLILLFRVHQMRETEQKRNFPPPPQVSTGIRRPKVCWIPLLSVNFCTRHFRSVTVDTW
jgi:hypothetical protein